jgi:hypothetical protein
VSTSAIYKYNGLSFPAKVTQMLKNKKGSAHTYDLPPLPQSKAWKYGIPLPFKHETVITDLQAAL